jgi:hypothetical protein
VQLPIGVVVVLLVVAGLLLSRIHFCMVAATAKAMHGDWATTRVITLISIGISAVLLALEASGSVPRQLEPSWPVLAGGFSSAQMADTNDNLYLLVVGVSGSRRTCSLGC